MSSRAGQHSHPRMLSTRPSRHSPGNRQNTKAPAVACLIMTRPPSSQSRIAFGRIPRRWHTRRHDTPLEREPRGGGHRGSGTRRRRTSSGRNRFASQRCPWPVRASIWVKSRMVEIHADSPWRHSPRDRPANHESENLVQIGLNSTFSSFQDYFHPADGHGERHYRGSLNVA